MKSRLAFLFIVLASAGKIFAADVTADFNTANELYAKGKFAGAANAYEKILATGTTSPNLLFNYGNAEFKLGNSGKAIAAYRRAELLAPRDEDVRANLAFARKQVQGDSASESRWQSWLGQLTLNEWTTLTVAAFWLTFLLFAARQISPALVPKLKSLTSIFIGLTILFGTALGLQASEHFSNRTAVVTADDATARSGPFDDAQEAFIVHDGTELSVLNSRGDWFQITDASGKIGWLQKAQVEILPGA